MAYTLLSGTEHSQPQHRWIMASLGIAMRAAEGDVIGPATPQIMWGTGVPVEAAPNGSTAFRLDASNQAEAVYHRIAGAWVSSIPVEAISMGILGPLASLTLPAVNLGSELATRAGIYVLLQATREVAETAGTTTMQLEIDGVAIVGATISWTSADPDFSAKSVVISEAVAVGARFSFRVTAAGTDADTIRARVS